MSITLIALAGFDVAAVTLLRGYLLSQTDSTLQRGLDIARPQLPTLLGRVKNGEPVLRVRLLRLLGEYYLAFVSGHGSTVILESDPGLVPRLPAELPALAAGQARPDRDRS